jgi:hypothetical protein
MKKENVQKLQLKKNYKDFMIVADALLFKEDGDQLIIMATQAPKSEESSEDDVEPLWADAGRACQVGTHGDISDVFCVSQRCEGTCSLIRQESDAGIHFYCICRASQP